jgi:hypothetical protein
VDQLESLVAADPTIGPVDLVAVVAQQFGVSVHPRSIGRALARRAEARARQGAPKNGLTSQSNSPHRHRRGSASTTSMPADMARTR